MPSLADVVRQHGPSYEARYGSALLPSHLRALRDVRNCRTAAMGGHLLRCADCGTPRLAYHSCRNRVCARCGGDYAAAWLAKQRQLLLPVPYFHVVFTLPAELRPLVRTRQRALIPVLFRAAFQSLSALCADRRLLGGQIGALGVLHTWGRTLEWHPHVHLLVPGGALSPQGQWLEAKRRRRRPREPYLVPVRALSLHFWGRFLALARQALPGVALPAAPRKKRWVVHAKPVLQGPERVLDYLGRYVHRTAIADRAILDTSDQTVTFRYRDTRDQRSKTMTLQGNEFLRRFLQHVLPRGLHRIRSFGLLHPSHRATLQRLQLMLGARAPRSDSTTKPPTTPRCSHCGSSRLHRGPRLSPLDCATLALALQAAAPARAPPLSPSS